MKLRSAVFLDRDGTITELDGYITTPEQLRLFSDAASCIRDLQSAGYLCILTTNQSAVGRGMISEDELNEIHQTLQNDLAAKSTRLDGIYHCPRVPGTSDETVVEVTDRKPGPGLLLQAARDHHVDLGRSWMIGDRLSDVLAGFNAGCRSIRVTTGYQYSQDLPPVDFEYPTVDSLTAAVEYILRQQEIDRIQKSV